MIHGTRRLWTDETINEVIGIDERFVSIRGHSNPFVYDHLTGELADGIEPRSITSGEAPLHPAIEISDVSRGRWSKVSRDGRWAAVASLGNRVRVFDNTSGEMKFADDPPCAFENLAFSPDGSRIAALADGAWIFGGEPQRVAGIQYGLAFAGEDLVGGVAGKLARWNVDGSERARVSIRHKVENLTFSADGRFAAVTTVYTSGLCMAPMPDIVVADLVRGHAILRFRDIDDISRTVTLSPNARWLVLSDGELTRLLSAEPRAPWSAPPPLARWEQRYLVPSPDDRALLVDHESNAELIALPSGEVLGTKRKLENAGLLWSPDGRFIAQLPLDQSRVLLRDPRTLEVIGEHGFNSVLDSIAISRDGKQLAVTDGPTIEIRAL